MMNKEKRASSGPVVHIGTSFLLVIFIILCLVTFAVLSLSSALRDQGYSKKEATRTTAYYEANGTAQEKLAEIVTAFEEGKLDDVDGITVGSLEADATTSSSDTSNSTATNSGKATSFTEVSYTVNMGDTQTLEVVLQLSDKNDLADGTYQITKWKEVSSTDWNGSSTLPVMDSGQLEAE